MTDPENGDARSEGLEDGLTLMPSEYVAPGELEPIVLFRAQKVDRVGSPVDTVVRVVIPPVWMQIRPRRCVNLPGALAMAGGLVLLAYGAIQHLAWAVYVGAIGVVIALVCSLVVVIMDARPDPDDEP